MLIRIRRGTYGHRENGRVVAKNSSSEPFTVADEEGRRLIMMEAAVEVAEAIETAEVTASIEKEDMDIPEEKEKSLEDMTKRELLEYASGLEIAVSLKMKKADIVEAIREYLDDDGPALSVDVIE